MKYLLILTFLFFCQFIVAQEFIVDPTQNQMQFGSEDVIYQKTQIVNQSDYSGATQTIYAKNESGVFEIAKIGYSGISKAGELELLNGKGETGVSINAHEFQLHDGANPKVLITPNNGYQHYEGGNLRFLIDGGAIQGYKADGTRTIKISTSFGGDGRITTDELELIGGSDLSEHFDIENETQEIKPGMLVSIANASGKLEITNSKRDKKVVGIISGANGIETGLLMGQKGSIAYGDYPVALTGRTYVYANTENGPIEAGDFLTSSSTSGHAMKVKKFKKSQGAIIGKAMTELESGEGFVLVLVNLQ